MATFAHILTATDFSEASRRAVALAASLAHDAGAALTVLHVCEIPGFGDEGPLPYDLATPLVAEAQGRLDASVRAVERECPGARPLLKLGVPWQEILATVAEVRADLVVMGTQGRRGVAHALLGSVAERVLRLATVPVMTIRARGAE